MAKRFTDTDKWRKQFIRKLPSAYKIFWLYLLDDCDHAGIWTVDEEIASIKIGETIDTNIALDLFNEKEERIVVVNDGLTWFIPSFIEFQYGELKQNNRAHISVINLLIKHGLEDATKYKYAHKIGSGISDKLKTKIFVRDDFTCVYCDSTYDPAFLSHDHVIPRADGGDHSEGNIVTACTKCNREKSDLSIQEFCKRSGFDYSEVIKRVNASKEAPCIAPSIGVKDKEKDKDKDKAKAKKKYSADFEYWWKECGKGSKANAFKRWNEQSEKPCVDELIAIHKQYLIHCGKEDRSLKDSEGWISGRFWETDWTSTPTSKPKEDYSASMYDGLDLR